MTQQKFATVSQWVAMTGIGRTTSYSLMADGVLPTFKIGKRVLVDVDAGIAWIRQQPAADIRCGRRPRPDRTA